MARLLASIPLMNYGYPPICIGLAQRAEYYAAINKVRTAKHSDWFYQTIHTINPHVQAYEGDHGALTQSIFHGMKETITSVQSL